MVWIFHSVKNVPTLLAKTRTRLVNHTNHIHNHIMKKAMSLFMLSLACAGTVCAQSTDASTTTSPVSATATKASELTDGYYVLKCQVTKEENKALTKSTGYAYHKPGQYGPFRFSSTATTAPDFSQGFTNDNLKYVWKLTKKTGNSNEAVTFTLQNSKSQGFMVADKQRNLNMHSRDAVPAVLAYETYNKSGDENYLKDGVLLYQTNFSIKESVTKLYIHANAPGGDMNLSYWNGNGLPGTAVQVEFYKVTSDDVFELTYAFKKTEGTGNAHTQNVHVATGCNYPTCALPAFTEATWLQGTVTAADKDKTKVISWTNTKFVTGQYYFLDLGNNAGYLHDQTGEQMTLGQDYQTKTLADKSQLWKFVGSNPWEGYQIVNAQSGGLLNANPTVTSGTGENNPVTVKQESEIPQGNISRWMATASSYRRNGFYLHLKGHDKMKMNFRSPKLAFWNGGADGGSTFTASTVLPAQRMVTDNSESFASLYLPFAVTLPEGVKAYTATSVGNGNLNLTEIAGNIVPENTGVVLVKAPAAENVELNIAPESAAAPTALTNLFKGTLTAMAADGKLAFGKTEKTGIGFYSVAAGTQIPANRAYLEQSALQGQQALKLNFDGEATGIEMVEGQLLDNQTPVYDLSGRRVVKTVKGGLYIQNGKKFIAQ